MSTDTVHPKTVAWKAFCDDATDFDRAVATTPGIDAFCSSSFWVIPAHLAFTPTHQPKVARVGDAFVAWAEAATPERIHCPLESMWLLSTPIVGPPSELATAVDVLVGETLGANPKPASLWVSGLQRDSLLFNLLVRRLQGHMRLFIGPASQRHHIELASGFDAWFSKRSAGFRKKARQGLRRAFQSGMQLDHFDGANCGTADDGAALYERIYRIETRSWKGLEGSGFVDGGMRAFYAHMVPRLAARGALRAIVGRLGDEDVCFIFGGIFAGTFRGLQMSFDERHRELELGNAMQLSMLERLQTESIGIYDLGSDMDYKARWSDRVFETLTLVGRR